MLKTSISIIALAAALSVTCAASFAQSGLGEPHQGSTISAMNMSTPAGPRPGGPGRPHDHDDDDDDDDNDDPTPGRPDLPEPPDTPDLPPPPDLPAAPPATGTTNTSDPGDVGAAVPGGPERPTPPVVSADLDQRGCGEEVSRLEHIRISAYALAAVDGPVEIVEVCPQHSLMDSNGDPALLHRGNVVGMSHIIANNRALNGELAEEHFAPTDVVAVFKGNGATYVYVHKFSV